MHSGLVLEQAIEPSLARYAISESGVSLSYLKKLLNTLDLYDDFTAAEAIKSLVLRITKEKKTRSAPFSLHSSNQPLTHLNIG